AASLHPRSRDVPAMIRDAYQERGSYRNPSRSHKTTHRYRVLSLSAVPYSEWTVCLSHCRRPSILAPSSDGAALVEEDCASGAMRVIHRNEISPFLVLTRNALC